MRTSTIFRLAIVIALLLGAGGAAAVAGVFGSGDSDTSAPIYQPQATLPTVTTADARLSAAIAPLRREQTAADVPAAGIVLGVYAEQHGANRGGARLARTDPSGGEVYLVPANGGLCLVSSDYFVTGCRSTEDILAGQDMSAIVCSPFMAADDVAVYGILPDTATSVAITRADGTSVPASVRGGVLVYEAPKAASLPQTVTWTSPEGRQSAATNMPDDAGTEKCDTRYTPAQAAARIHASAIEDPPPSAGPSAP